MALTRVLAFDYSETLETVISEEDYNLLNKEDQCGIVQDFGPDSPKAYRVLIGGKKTAQYLNDAKKAGIKIYIVTNNGEDAKNDSLKLLSNYGVTSDDSAYCSNKNGDNSKDAGNKNIRLEDIRKINNLDANSPSIMFFDDSKNNIEAAAKLSFVQAIHVPSSNEKTPREQYEDKAEIIHTNIQSAIESNQEELVDILGEDNVEDLHVDTDVLVVGAGPIGLANALGMKKLNPDLNIVVLEKYEEYQRKHTLVMDPKQFGAYMKAIGVEKDSEFNDLLQKLKKDPHIRTNELQNFLTQQAKKAGIVVKTQEVTKDYIQNHLKTEYPNLELIVGADGTHSVVSDTLFGLDNQVKYEFDYVLQLRYEIEGNDKAAPLNSANFIQEMARHGVIANEYVGSHSEKDKKTPVTMQMMISKADFDVLKQFTSKSPFKPFTEKDKEKLITLPENIQSFINGYINHRRKKLSSTHNLLTDSVTISVNAAPATHAKNVFKPADKNNPAVLLVGDSALGLSYFKGLNAGFEAAANFFNTIKPAIHGGFKNNVMADKLSIFQEWFLKVLSPKKVKEVESYSFWRIRSAMGLMKAVNEVKTSSAEMAFEKLSPLQEYYDHLKKDPLMEAMNKNHIYPHRKYDPVQFGQIDYVHPYQTIKKIAKLLIDFVKPYKSTHQISQDFKQPLVGIGNFFVGLFKLLKGLFTLNAPLLLDGVLHMLRSIIEIATTPLAWFIKPLTRGMATLIHGGFKKIEEGAGIKELAQIGLGELDKNADAESIVDSYALVALCNDIHRKVDKGLQRGQKSDLIIKESGLYNDIRNNSQLDKKNLRQYFLMFSRTEKQKEVDEVLGLEIKI